MCFAILVLQSRIIKNQEAVCRNIQCLRDGKQGVERDGLFDVRRFHMADEGGGAVNALGRAASDSMQFSDQAVSIPVQTPAAWVSPRYYVTQQRQGLI